MSIASSLTRARSQPRTIACEVEDRPAAVLLHVRVQREAVEYVDDLGDRLALHQLAGTVVVQRDRMDREAALRHDGGVVGVPCHGRMHGLNAAREPERSTGIDCNQPHACPHPPSAWVCGASQARARGSYSTSGPAGRACARPPPARLRRRATTSCARWSLHHRPPPATLSHHHAPSNDQYKSDELVVGIGVDTSDRERAHSRTLRSKEPHRRPLAVDLISHSHTPHSRDATSLTDTHSDTHSDSHTRRAASNNATSRGVGELILLLARSAAHPITDASDSLPSRCIASKQAS